MYPKELGENVIAEENKRLQKALAIAMQENAQLLSRAIKAEGELEQCLLREGENQRLLAASKETQEAQAETIRQANIDISALTKMYQEVKQEADKAHLALTNEQTARATAEEQNRALKNRNWVERLTRKGE